MISPVLAGKIQNARARCRHSNCYRLESIEQAVFILESGKTLLFAVNDHGVNRLYYFTEELEDLERVFNELPEGRFYLELITRDPEEFLPRSAKVTARLMRVANPDCRAVFSSPSVGQYRNDGLGFLAEEKDAEEANRLLWSTFHTEVSHLLYDEELRQVIRKKQLVLHRGSETGCIDALLQMEVLPKKFYINQVINKTEKGVIHALLLKQLWDYTQQGGKYLCAWAEENNIASLRFHGKYGMEHDGLWNIIYLIER